MIPRRLRNRFGIATPHVAVRAHLPWQWRALCVVTSVVLLLGLVVWVFDAGRRIGGFDQNEFKASQAANAALESEAGRLRGLMAACENTLQIDQATQKQLMDKNSALIEENARLKEEIAVIERLVRQQSKMKNPR